MLRLLKYLNKRAWALTVLALALVVLQVALDLSLPDYMEEITELVESEGSTMHEILHAGRSMLLAALGSLCSAVLTVLLAARAGALLAATLRERVFAKVESFSGEEISRFTAASLITRTTGDVQQLQLAFVLGLEVLIKAPVKAIWAIIKICNGDLRWGVITAIGTVTFSLITVLLITLCLPHFRRMQRCSDDLNRITRENVTGIHAIRAQAAEKHEEHRFEHVNEALTKTHLFTAQGMSLLSPAMQLVNNLLTVACYWVGVMLINAAPVAERLGLFSNTVSTVSYAMQIFTAFVLFATVSTALPRAAVSAKRVREVLNTPVALKEGSVCRSDVENIGCVELRDVSFSYPEDRAALHALSLCAKKGETVALIGATGCGKSVAMQLVVRLFDATKGEVLVDGVNVREYCAEALYSKIGYVDQEPFLFRGTVRENVAFGNGGAKYISDEALSALFAEIGAPDFENTLPHGWDSAVDEGGTNLSEGQLHRIALARALCSDPEILVLDDFFSAFDRLEGAHLRKTLRESRQDLTVLIAAQRVATVKRADQIIVLAQGDVVGRGTHEELLAQCEAYRILAVAQSEEVFQ